MFLFIFSLFLFTFFTIIEGEAVVIQPPQYYTSVARICEKATLGGAGVNNGSPRIARPKMLWEINRAKFALIKADF